MRDQNRFPRARGASTIFMLVAIGALAACQPAKRETRAPIDYRGTQPGAAAPAATAPAPATASSDGIVTSGGVSYLRARDGDTVASLTARHGFSPSEIAAYNGLRPDSPLLSGDELVVPAGAVAGGSAGTRVATAAPSLPPSAPIESTPLPPSGGTGTTGVLVNPDGSLATVPAPGTPADGAPVWTPSIAADAIARSTGVRADGTLGAPPSSTNPVPPEPRRARDLESPGLGQYRTGASSGAATTPPATPEPAREDRVAAAPPSAPATGLRLTTPVRGRIAVGFGETVSGARNDGIDFAAPAGSPVVAAADGEVALVSDTLGKLGTIILVRHADEILTVYGRVDGVTVSKGDIVQRGQKIGVVSDAAAPSEPRMHFEVRRGATVLDPTPLL